MSRKKSVDQILEAIESVEKSISIDKDVLNDIRKNDVLSNRKIDLIDEMTLSMTRVFFAEFKRVVQEKGYTGVAQNADVNDVAVRRGLHDIVGYMFDKYDIGIDFHV